MADKRKAVSSRKTPKVEDLAPKKEVPQELMEDEAEAVQGGMRKAGGDPQSSGKEFLQY